MNSPPARGLSAARPGAHTKPPSCLLCVFPPPSSPPPSCRDLFIEMHFGPKRYVDPEPFANSLLLDHAIQQVGVSVGWGGPQGWHCTVDVGTVTGLFGVERVGPRACLRLKGMAALQLEPVQNLCVCCLLPAGRPGVPQAAAEQAGGGVCGITAPGQHTAPCCCAGRQAQGCQLVFVCARAPDLGTSVTDF